MGYSGNAYLMQLMRKNPTGPNTTYWALYFSNSAEECLKEPARKRGTRISDVHKKGEMCLFNEEFEMLKTASQYEGDDLYLDLPKGSVLTVMTVNDIREGEDVPEDQLTTLTQEDVQAAIEHT